MIIENYTYFIPNDANDDDWFYIECYRILVSEKFKLETDPFNINVYNTGIFISQRNFVFEKFLQQPLKIKFWNQNGLQKESMRLERHTDTFDYTTNNDESHVFIVSKISSPSADIANLYDHQSIKGLLSIIYGQNFLYELEANFILNKKNEMHTISEEISEPFIAEITDIKIHRDFNSN